MATTLAIFLLGVSLLSINPCQATSPRIQQETMPSCSQASQDRFVYVMLYEFLGKSDEGYYLEIGAGHPSYGNNSYILEKTLGWKGVSIDISDEYQKAWSYARTNPLFIEDAIQSNYLYLLRSFPKTIDYLSLDIDSSYDVVLQKIPFHEHIFKIITIEHDFYRFGELYRKKEREILSSLGYYLLCPDVSVFFNGADSVFEDWWIHPSAFSDDMISALTSLNLKGKDHNTVINLIRSCQYTHKDYRNAHAHSNTFD